VVGKFLRIVPHMYWHIIVVIHTLLDIETLTLANVTGCLKAEEDELEVPPPTVNHISKLYLSEEAWEEKWKLRDGNKPYDGGPGSRGGVRRDDRSNIGRGSGDNHGSNASSSNGPAKLGRN
jgi:hypothetical protein